MATDTAIVALGWFSLDAVLTRSQRIVLCVTYLDRFFLLPQY